MESVFSMQDDMVSLLRIGSCVMQLGALHSTENALMNIASSAMQYECFPIQSGNSETYPREIGIRPSRPPMQPVISKINHGSYSMHTESSSMHTESSSMHPGCPLMYPGSSEMHPEMSSMHPRSSEKHDGSSTVVRENSAIYRVSSALYPGSSLIDPRRQLKHAECTMWNPAHFSITHDETVIYNHISEMEQESSAIYSGNSSIHIGSSAMNNNDSAIEVRSSEIPLKSSTEFENSVKQSESLLTNPEDFSMPPKSSEIQTEGSDVNVNTLSILPKSSLTQIENEILQRNPTNDHELSVNFTLENFSDLPHYIIKKDCSLNQGCSVTWNIEVILRRNMKRTSCIDLQVKLFRNGNESRILRTNLRIALYDSNSQILHDSVFSSLCSSEYLPSISWITVILHENTLYPLCDDKLNVCLVFKVNDCCLKNYIPETKGNDDSDTFNMLSLDFQNDMRTAYESKLLNDLSLVVGEETYEVDKFVLCARSPVFNNLFGLGSQPHTFYRLDPACKSKEVMNAFLLYLYTGIIGDVDMDTVCGLYAVAKEFDIMALSSACGHIMLLNITPANACKVLILVNEHRDVFLKDSVLRFIKKNIVAVEGTSDWRFVSRNLPVLKSEVLNFFTTS